MTFAIDLKQNPQMEFPEGTSRHVQSILRKHVATPDSRYNQEEIWSQIEALHTPCKEYVDAHPHQTQTIEKLPNERAQELAKGHKAQLRGLLACFKNMYPESALFSPDHKWYSVTYMEHESPVESAPVTTALPKTSSNRYSLYAYAGIAAAAAVALFIYNLAYNTEANKGSSPTPG